MNKSTLVYDDPAALEWASKRILGIEFRDDAHSIARKINGRFVGVVVFDTWTDTGCQVHVASNGSQRWISRIFVMEAFAYPFMTAQRKRISALVSVNNAPSLRFCRAFGWKEEGVLREAGPDGEDMILFGMLQRECRFLNVQKWPRYIDRRAHPAKQVNRAAVGSPKPPRATSVIDLEPVDDDAVGGPESFDMDLEPDGEIDEDDPTGESVEETV